MVGNGIHKAFVVGHARAQRQSEDTQDHTPTTKGLRESSPETAALSAAGLTFIRSASGSIRPVRPALSAARFALQSEFGPGSSLRLGHPVLVVKDSKVVPRCNRWNP